MGTSEDFLQEMQVLKKIRHPNCILFIGYTTSPEVRSTFFISIFLTHERSIHSAVCVVAHDGVRVHGYGQPLPSAPQSPHSATSVRETFV